MSGEGVCVRVCVCLCVGSSVGPVSPVSRVLPRVEVVHLLCVRRRVMWSSWGVWLLEVDEAGAAVGVGREQPRPHPSTCLLLLLLHRESLHSPQPQFRQKVMEE